MPVDVEDDAMFEQTFVKNKNKQTTNKQIKPTHCCIESKMGALTAGPNQS